MTRTQIFIAFSSVVLLIYVGSIFLGLRVTDMSTCKDGVSSHPGVAWQPPSLGSIPRSPLGDSIRRGALIFDQTPLYAANYTVANISCSSCHADRGMQPFASPVVGLPRLFPKYNARAGRIISLRERIEECFVRSENGKPLPYTSAPMQDLLAYIDWVSTPQPNHQPFQGRGLISLPDLKPNAPRGQQIYATQCAGCHGTDGQGRAPLFPPIWGAKSFNDGAGMNGIHKMAAFVQHNMPQNRMGILSPQDAFDVAAYIHSQPRPTFNSAYERY